MIAAETIARVTREQHKAEEWALVLVSASIPFRVEACAGEWTLIVGAGDVARATTVLEAYERENLKPPQVVLMPVDHGPTYAGIVMAILLVGFYCVTGPRDASVVWFRQGSASGARILHGELWRTLTALTLHADLPHVASNAVFCGLLGTALCRTVGPGVGAWLMLLAGAGGNTINVLLRGAQYSGVGASTAILGAVGSLGAWQFVNRSRSGATKWRAWVPIAAALGLLAMVGTGKQTDFLAHGFGFLVGAVLGGVVALLLRQQLSPRVQMTLAFGALAGVAAAWLMALS